MREKPSSFDYSSEFGSLYHSARRLPPNAEGWIGANRARKLQPLIRPSDVVLEYGVGFGWNLMSVKCAEKVGFDVTPELAESVKAKGIRFEGREDRLKAGYYDVVLCHHVLEHLKRPITYLNKIKTLLRKSGRLIVFVPFEREQKYLHYNARNKAHHVYSWTPASLKALIERADLTVSSVELGKFRFDRIAAVLANRVKGGFGVYQLLRSAGLFILPEYEIALVATI